MGQRSQSTRSVRIDAEVDEQLRRLAVAQGVSVNAVATRALRRYTEWDIFADRFGFIDMPASIVGRMFEGLTDEQVRGLGHWAGSTLLKEYVTFWFKEVSLETVLEACPRLFAKYGRLFEYEERDEGGRRTVVLKHQGGPRVSAFYEELVRSAFEVLLARPVALERTDNQVVARFASPGPQGEVARLSARERDFSPSGRM